MGEPTEPAGYEAMADKRLDDIGAALVVADGPTIAHELYYEVRRLRALEESYIVALDQASIGDVQRAVARADTAERELAKMQELDGDWEPGRWRRVRRPDGSLWMETSDHDEAEAEAERTGWPLERQYVNTRSEWRVVSEWRKATDD